MRKEFKLTQTQFDVLRKAIRPVPYLALQCGEPASPQERANAAWATLGNEIGFDGMSVEPVQGKGSLFFTAEETSRVFMDGDLWCAVFPGFRDLQQDFAGFGRTPKEAREELNRASSTSR